MANGDARGAVARVQWRSFWLLTISGAAACLQLLACSSLDKNDSSSNGSWTCFMKEDVREPCQCQTTPVGGKQQIVDHCGPEFVTTDAGAPADAECCKDWIWLNNKPVSAYYCSCYAKGTHSCNVAIGDELVDSCP